MSKVRKDLVICWKVNCSGCVDSGGCGRVTLIVCLPGHHGSRRVILLRDSCTFFSSFYGRVVGCLLEQVPF